MSGADGDEQGGHADGIRPLTAYDPEHIGSYRLLGRLGAGGMGRVFLARSRGGRTVAVKVVHEEHVADEHFRARFRREVKAARKVGDRYTAPVLDADPDAEQPWVATGYVPGLSLEQVVREHGPLDADAVQALADGLLRALKDIHGAGIVHRDLKPSNVMLTVDGTRIIDFGIARALEPSVESLLTSTGMVIGSPGFMSPEQIQGEPAEPGSDVFTLGCVLMYAATGRLPFGRGARNQHAVMYQITNNEPDLAGLDDPGVRGLVERCLNKDPGQRPGVDELLASREGERAPAARGSWLPADVVVRLAQRSARLLDAEAVPLRDSRAERVEPGEPVRPVEPLERVRPVEPLEPVQPVDRATAGLLPRPAAPEPAPGAPEPAAGPAKPAPAPREPAPGAVEAAPAAPEPPPVAGEAPPRRPEKRHRRTFIAVPIVAVLTVGGGTVAILQPFAGSDGGGGAHAQAPGSGPSATPAGSGSPTGTPSTHSSKAAQKPRAGGGSSAPPTGDSPSHAPAGTDNSPGSPRTSGSPGSKATPKPPSPHGGGGPTVAAGSPPAAMTTYKVMYNESCFGACSMPLTVSWSPISRATRYEIHYTNNGSQYTAKNVDTTYSTGSTAYTISGPYSGDKICVKVRAANTYGPSAWAQTWCNTVPY